MKNEIPTLRRNNLTMRESNANKKLLTLKEVCDYLGIGQTKARELVRGHNGFGVQIGNRWYADKNKLDRWIDTMAL
uniref:helix-turn-helix domain-containing protein n=1 Tax=Enterocloster aldenensis TaxID=358742 RepID=UPI001F482B68